MPAGVNPGGKPLEPKFGKEKERIDFRPGGKSTARKKNLRALFLGSNTTFVQGRRKEERGTPGEAGARKEEKKTSPYFVSEKE